MKSPTKTLTEFIVKHSFDGISKDATHQTKRLILDTIGCALEGGKTKEAKLVLDLILALGGNYQSTIMGDRHRTRALGRC
jgi:2-methylcitrate dehydratase PrpD